MPTSFRILVAIFLSVLGACSPTPQQEFAAAQVEFASGDYRAARLLLVSALDDEPANAPMRLLLARVLIGLGDGDGAEAALDGLAKQSPPTGELAELSAEAALLRRQPDAAMQALSAVETIEGERLHALAMVQKLDLPGAAKHFEKGMAAGGNARLLADYSRFKLMQGDPDGAEHLADQAVRAAPNGLDTLLIVGDLARRKGDLARALDSYTKAAKLHRASLAAITGRAAGLGDLGRLDEMENTLARAIAAAPSDPGVASLRARLAAARGDWAKVKTIIQAIEPRLVAADPLRELYGEALMRLGQHHLAVAQLVEAGRARPNDAKVNSLLAEALLATGDGKRAAMAVRPFADRPIAERRELGLMAEAARSIGDSSASVYAQRAKEPQLAALAWHFAAGDAAMRKENWALAVRAYEHVLSVTDGKDPATLNNMAYAQSKLGNAGKARHFANLALQAAPNNPSVLDTAGWVEFKSRGDMAKALRLLRQAAKGAPANKTIRVHLNEVIRQSLR